MALGPEALGQLIPRRNTNICFLQGGVIRIILSVERNDNLGTEEIRLSFTNLLEVGPNNLPTKMESVDSLFTLDLLYTIDDDLSNVLLTTLSVSKRTLLDSSRNTGPCSGRKAMQELCKLFPCGDPDVRLPVLTTSLIRSRNSNLTL